MKTLYLECNMGAAGDMLTAALLELHPDPDGVIAWLNGLDIPCTVIKKEAAVKCGIHGTHVSVTVNGEDEDSLDVISEDAGHTHAHTHDHEHARTHDHEHTHEHAHADVDAHTHECEHTHADADAHAHENEHDHMHEHTHADADAHTHEYEHEHMHEHAHADAHIHDHENAHDHAHDHEYAHTHDHGHIHAHHHLADIEHIVAHLTLPEKVRTDIMNVYRMIAEAEAHVHGTTPDQIHFHEVGTMDAVMDVAAVCLLIYELKPEKIVASPVHVGFGEVRCAHGVLPVPAPATAFLLRDIPTYGGAVQGELCTPTGAALLRYFVNEFGEQPVMKVEKIGYGMGKKDFERANLVRAMLGQTAEAGDRILELRCNVDDMTGEELGYCMGRLMAAGARDVFTTAVGMKKDRPGTLVTVICDPEKRERMLEVLFRDTTTLGVRETVCSRHILSRTEETVETGFGPVRVKYSEGFGVKRCKAEYEDLARIAVEQNCSIGEVRKKVSEILDREIR